MGLSMWIVWIEAARLPKKKWRDVDGPRLVIISFLIFNFHKGWEMTVGMEGCGWNAHKTKTILILF